MIVLIIFAIIYYRIADQYNKNKWIWTAVGALGYAAIQFVLSLIHEILAHLGYITISNHLINSLIIIAISGGIMYYFYTFLKKKWDSEDNTFSMNSINEIGKDQNQEN